MIEQEDNYIETVAGIQFHFLNPSPDEININDIANSLSKQCRYTGHVKQFYSVTEHCCLLFDFAWVNKNRSIQELRTMLMHDASEAYLTDLARPIKYYMPEYKTLEAKIEKVISEKFDLIYPYPSWIKELDTRILLDERKQAMNPSNNVWAVDSLEPLGVTLNFWDPEKACKEYLKRYEMVQ